MGKQSREQAKKILNELEAKEGEIPVKSVAERFNMPPEIVTLHDEVRASSEHVLDTLIEGTRYDLRSTPDLSGIIYGYTICMTIDDFATVAGVLGEALIRLAKMPDFVSPEEELLEALEENNE